MARSPGSSRASAWTSPARGRPTARPWRPGPATVRATRSGRSAERRRHPGRPERLSFGRPGTGLLPVTSVSGLQRCSGGAVAFGVASAQGQAVSRCRRIGAYGATGGVEGALEEQRLDTYVVVEPFQVAKVGRGGGHVGMQVRAAVAGDLQVVGGRDGGDAEPLGDAAA